MTTNPLAGLGLMDITTEEYVVVFPEAVYRIFNGQVYVAVDSTVALSEEHGIYTPPKTIWRWVSPASPTNMKTLNQVEATEAWMAGMDVEYLHGGFCSAIGSGDIWRSVPPRGDLPVLVLELTQYSTFRLRPTKKTVPWRRSADIPEGAVWIHCKHSTIREFFDPIIVINEGLVRHSGYSHIVLPWSQLEDYEWSDASRKEWKPCTVEVNDWPPGQDAFGNPI
jgi:hypothetical protein